MSITVTTADNAENLDRAGGRVMRLLVDASRTSSRFLVRPYRMPTTFH